MSRRTQFLVAMSFFCTIVLGGSEAPLQADQCYGCSRGFIPYNNFRRVFGNDLDLECPDEPWSTGYWGNWGVDSNMGSRNDTTQFNGWKSKNSQRQWNSCTELSETEYPPPNSSYYNDNNYTTQKGYQDDWRSYGNLFLGWGYFDCSVYDEYVWTVTGNYLDLYELDEMTADDFADVLHPGNIDVPIDCVDNNCTGQSSDIGPVTGDLDRTSAKVRTTFYADEEPNECP